MRTYLQAICQNCKAENECDIWTDEAKIMLTCPKCSHKQELIIKPAKQEVEQCSHPSYAMEKHGSTEMCRKCGKTWE